MAKKKNASLFETETQKYDFHISKDDLIRDGQKIPDVHLLPMWRERTLLDMGDKGMLKGMAYGEYLELKGEK